LLNQEVIAATLCVEKDVVNSCCKGSCQLNERLSNAQGQSDDERPANDQRQMQEQVYVSDADEAVCQFTSLEMNNISGPTLEAKIRDGFCSYTGPPPEHA